jgi:hypothetical protein
MIRRSSTPDVFQTFLSIYQFKGALSRKSAPLAFTSFRRPCFHSNIVATLLPQCSRRCWSCLNGRQYVVKSLHSSVRLVDIKTCMHCWVLDTNIYAEGSQPTRFVLDLQPLYHWFGHAVTVAVSGNMMFPQIILYIHQFCQTTFFYTLK